MIDDGPLSKNKRNNRLTQRFASLKPGVSISVQQAQFSPPLYWPLVTAFDFCFTPGTESWAHLFSVAKTHLIVLHFCLQSSPLSPVPGKLVSLLSLAMPPLENQDSIATIKAGWPHLLRSSHGHVKFLVSLYCNHPLLGFSPTQWLEAATESLSFV